MIIISFIKPLTLEFYEYKYSGVIVIHSNGNNSDAVELKEMLSFPELHINGSLFELINY
jgi:hypothetical protein